MSNDKEEDFWKNYALQVRGENTELQRRLKEAEAAYTASLEALKEQLSAPKHHEVLGGVEKCLYEYVAEQDYAFHVPISACVCESFVTQAFNAAKNRYLMSQH